MFVSGELVHRRIESLDAGMCKDDVHSKRRSTICPPHLLCELGPKNRNAAAKHDSAFLLERLICSHVSI